MKILFIYYFFSLGGVETALQNRITGLRKINIDCHLLFMSKKQKGLFENDSKVYFTNNFLKIKKIIEGNNFDAISIIDTPIFYSLLKNIRYNGLIINECHSSNNEYLQYIHQVHNANAFIVPNYYGYKVLKEDFNIHVPIHIIPNGIDNNVFYFRNTNNNTYLNNHIKENQHILCWVGRLEPAKNPLEVIKLLKELKQYDNRIKLWMIGSYFHKKTYQNIINAVERYALNENFLWLPSIPYEDMPFIYSMVSNSGGCLLSTSERECYPMILLEAMSCNCPIVCTNIEGHREIIKHNISGLLYPLNNIEEGVKCLKTILYNKSIRDTIINQSYNQVSKNNNILRLASLYKDVLTELIQNKNQGNKFHKS